MKNILLIIGALLLVISGVYYFLIRDTSDTYTKAPEIIAPIPVANETATQTPAVVNEENVTEENEPTSIIGKSVEGNDIIAYHFGNGDNEILLVGGIHGGYSWNTSLLSFELIDWLASDESIIPENVKVTIIPVLNPDGLKKVTGTTGKFTADEASKVEVEKITGRSNGNNVDLNRNFDCEWKSTGTWQNKTVSGGESVFSEPESKALRDYVVEEEPVTAIAWYSAAGGVYASNCGNGPSTKTLSLTNLFAEASGYVPHEKFDYYEISGDMVNWLSSQNIPAISVLLTDHEKTEFSKNKAGVEAILNQYKN